MRPKNGASEEVRTLDIYLGKVVLYQLSYARMHLQVVFRHTLSNSILEKNKGAAKLSWWVQSFRHLSLIHFRLYGALKAWL